MKAALLACGVAAGVIAQSVSAAIVHFSNPAPDQPGHFAWQDSWSIPKYLNITSPAAEQNNEPTGRSVSQIVLGFPTGGVWGQLGLFEGGPSVFPRIGGAIVPPWDDPEVLPLLHGDTLSGLEFLDFGFFAWGYPPSTTSSFPEAARRYIGVLTADNLFGWIEVERAGLSFIAHAWAYETQPGVPLLAGQIPAPGAAALLALVSITTIRRRRS